MVTHFFFDRVPLNLLEVKRRQDVLDRPQLALNNVVLGLEAVDFGVVILQDGICEGARVKPDDVK